MYIYSDFYLRLNYFFFYLPAAALPTLFMTGHCRTLVDGYLHDKDRIYVDSSIVVEATPNLELETQTTCVVTFAARDPSERLILHFESMDINFRPGTIDR